MKNSLFLWTLIFQLVAISVYGQVTKTYCYTDNGARCNRDSATWYRKLHCADTVKGTWEATDFYINGIIKRSKGAYVKETNSFFPNDTFINFNKAGQMESRGGFVYNRDKNLKNEKIGKWTFFYVSGKPKAEFNYEGITSDSHTDEFLISYWDTSGKQLVASGNGRYSYLESRGPEHDPSNDIHFISDYKDGKPDGELIGNYSNGQLYCKEQYSRGKLLKGESYDQAGKKYTYEKLEENPQYPGGDAGLINFLKENIEYPEFEKNQQIQGRVVVRFVVYENGSVKDAVILRSVTPGLDAEALRVVSRLHKFTPGKQRGQNVRVYFNLPMVYRLQ